MQLPGTKPVIQAIGTPDSTDMRKRVLTVSEFLTSDNTVAHKIERDILDYKYGIVEGVEVTQPGKIFVTTTYPNVWVENNGLMDHIEAVLEDAYRMLMAGADFGEVSGH